MKNSRLRYFCIVLLVIFLGICSRKIEGIPLFIGDLLYAIMIFYVVKMLFIKNTAIKSAVIAILICYSIEFFQLYQADWITTIRKSLLGRYVLGEGFLWSDILAYTFGVAIAYFIDSQTNKLQKGGRL